MTDWKSHLLTGSIALIFGFIGAAIWQFSGIGDTRTRAFLIDNPDILPEMAEAYDRQQAAERLASVEEDVVQPFPGAILGNPDGEVTLVEFSDYGCTYCRMSRPDIDALIAENPDLKVVVREWPIFQGSDGAAKLALAAAQQGKFAQFHDVMFSLGSPTPENMAQAAAIVELDMEKAQAAMESQDVELELARNLGLARQLGFAGTPSFVIGNRVYEGAVGKELLQEAISEARGS